MSFQPQQKPAQIVKILKKPKILKDNLKSQNNNEDEDNISAQSSHSGVYSEDVNRFKGKINPLPELGKQKKRFISKNLLAQEFRISNYQEKQVRQQENLMLKQKNNFLSSQNMKLKTKISTLEKENAKLQKILEEQPFKPKTPGLANLTKERFRPSNQNLSAKMIVKSLKKELQDLKKQNNNIKSSIKFTTISELECERDAILEQTSRLRAMLEEEQTKRISMKINQQGMSNLEQKLNNLQQRNSILMRQNLDLKSKLKTFEEGNTKVSKSSENQKNLSKTLYTVRRLLKEKEKEVEQLKDQVKSASSMHSLGMASEKSINSQLTNNLMPQSASNMPRKPSMQRPNPMSKHFEKRVVSKSAQKHGPKQSSQKPSTAGECENCKLLRSQIETLKKKITEFESAFQATNPLVIPTEPIEIPKEEQVKALTRFIEFRFKAHHLGLSESEKYLLNAQNITEEQLKKQLTLEQFLEIVVTEPFVVLNKRYIEVFLLEICCSEEIKKGTQKIKLDKDAKITKKTILQNYKKLLTHFELLPQAKEQEMFLQIAQLVTSYYQQILAAMSNRKNGDGTISEKDLSEFFTEIELEKEYIDFIITQIILESIDLERLNYFAFFEIFYIPQEEGEATQNASGGKKMGSQAVDKKKRFEVDQVVKQEDEEYEESRSHVDQSRQRTLSKQAQESGDSYHQLNSDDSPIKKQEHEQNDGEEDQYAQDYNEEEPAQKKPNPALQQKKTKQKKSNKQKAKQKQKKKNMQKDESYAEEFEQEKMNSEIQDEEEKVIEKKKGKKEPPQQLVEKPYEIEDIEDEYKDEFEN